MHGIDEHLLNSEDKIPHELSGIFPLKWVGKGTTLLEPIFIGIGWEISARTKMRSMVFDGNVS